MQKEEFGFTVSSIGIKENYPESFLTERVNLIVTLRYSDMDMIGFAIDVYNSVSFDLVIDNTYEEFFGNYKKGSVDKLISASR